MTTTIERYLGEKQNKLVEFTKCFFELQIETETSKFAEEMGGSQTVVEECVTLSLSPSLLATIIVSSYSVSHTD